MQNKLNDKSYNFQLEKSILTAKKLIAYHRESFKEKSSCVLTYFSWLIIWSCELYIYSPTFW